MHDPHQAPQPTRRPHTYTILTAIESTAGLGLAVLTLKKGYTPHQAAQLHRWIIKHGFTKSVLQSDHETSLMQLVSTSRHRPQTSYKGQSTLLTPEPREVERFHRNLFDQLRTTRLQWSKDLNIEPHIATRVSTLRTTSQHLHPEQLPRALIREDFSLRELPLRYNYHSNIVHFGEIVLGDVRNIPTQKLRLRNQHQKLCGIWLGRDLITNEQILALPLHYSQHPSTTTGAYRCRQITRAPREEQHDNKFLESIYWPQLSDDIDFNTREHFNNLQKQNIATRDLQLQQPQDEEDIEQPQGVQPPLLRHQPQAVAPPQEQQPQVLQPPPGLPTTSSTSTSTNHGKTTGSTTTATSTSRSTS